MYLCKSFIFLFYFFSISLTYQVIRLPIAQILHEILLYCVTLYLSRWISRSACLKKDVYSLMLLSFHSHSNSSVTLFHSNSSAEKIIGYGLFLSDELLYIKFIFLSLIQNCILHFHFAITIWESSSMIVWQRFPWSVLNSLDFCIHLSMSIFYIAHLLDS